MTSSNPESPARPPQGRSRDKVRGVLDAADELLSREGAGALVTTRVRRAGGVAVWSLTPTSPTSGDPEALASTVGFRHRGRGGKRSRSGRRRPSTNIRRRRDFARPAPALRRVREQTPRISAPTRVRVAALRHGCARCWRAEHSAGNPASRESPRRPRPAPPPPDHQAAQRDIRLHDLGIEVGTEDQ